MRDEETGGREDFGIAAGFSIVDELDTPDIFGTYSVIGPGVHIVLEGRQISITPR